MLRAVPPGRVGAICALVLVLHPWGAAASAQQAALLRQAGRLNHQFSSVTGLRELPDGRVLVADGIDEVVVRADFARQRLDTIGRPGQGPGEYKSPDGLFALPGGATLLLDLGNARLTVFDSAGRYRESTPLAQGSPAAGPGGFRLVIPRGTDARGRIYYQPMGGGPRADSAPVLRWDRGSGSTDTVGRVKLPDLVTRTSGGSANRSVVQRPQPYPVQDGWGVAADGRVALVRAPEYRVDWVDASGRVVRGPALAAPTVRIGTAEKREYLDEMASSGLRVAVRAENGQTSVSLGRGGQGGGAPDPSEFTWPAAKPPFAGPVLAAPDGSVWVERSVRAGAPREYDVIGPRGELLRRVAVPAGRRLVALGARHAYARHVDADGISTLERYERP
jgi:hypothetical protein